MRAASSPVMKDLPDWFWLDIVGSSVDLGVGGVVDRGLCANWNVA